MRFRSNYFRLFMILLIIEICIATFISKGFIRHTLGDFLVVIMLYCLIMSIFKLKPLIAAWLVLLIATAVELGQFFNIIEKLQLQGNQIARIVLGSVFSYGDLLAYLLGIMTVIIIEHRRSNTIS